MGRRRVETGPRQPCGRPRYAKIAGKFAHRLIVEQRTGIKLPAKAVIHHCDPADRLTNVGQLVVCEDNGYHQLIETRTRALKECGNANWKKCRKCLRWDDPDNMQSKEITPGFTKYWHYRFKGECVNKGERARTRRQAPRPAPFYRAGQVAMHHRRFIGPERAAEIERQRKEAFQVFLASESPTLIGGPEDTCVCGQGAAKRHGVRFHCIGCGRQKKAGFIRRSTQRNRRDIAMWVYVQSEPSLWTVGFYDPKGKWHTDSDHTSQDAAAERCAWLNGSRASVAA